MPEPIPSDFHKGKANPSVTGVVDTKTSPEALALKQLSENNIQRIMSDFLSKAVSGGVASDPDLLRQEVLLEATEMAKRYFFTLNLSSDSIARLLQVGRTETIWDHPDIELLQTSATVNNKSLPDDYLDTRRAAENGLRQFVPDECKNQNPIFTALAASDEDMTEGAAPRYGNWAVFIAPSPQIEQRTVFSAEDSFRSVNSEHLEFDNKNILSLEEAFIAKAVHKEFFEKFLDDDSRQRMHKLRNYVEAAIFSDIDLSDISHIVCSLNSSDEVESAKAMLDLIEPIKDKVRFVFGEDISIADRELFNL